MIRVPLAELRALRELERAAREYARFSHGNLAGIRYHQREEARDRLRDALSTLDVVRSKAA